MSDIEEQTEPKAIGAKITDADIDRQRQQIGISQFVHEHPFNRQVSEDVIRHYAFGMVGDDNPLWHEPDYGATTRWRGQIAPPLFGSSTGVNETPPYTPELKSLFKGLYRGVGRYNVGARWRLFKPMRPGDQLYHDLSVDDVQVKESSSFSGRRTVLERYRHLYVNRNGEPVAVRYESFVNAERGGSKEVGKHAHLSRHVYNKEEMAEIDRLYAAEQRRGAEPRWWEDVCVGDELVPVVKGPFGLVEVICTHMGWGLGSTYGGGPLRYGWKMRKKMPNFYSEDRYGVPSSMMRVHWDADRAQDLGLPAPYDYGQMRTNWSAHLVTNWMGDDAWISALESEVRMFNFHGDTTVMSGRVADKRIEGNDRIVDIDVRGTNQRQEVTIVAKATVLLPSREAGPMVLPQPDSDLIGRGAQLMTEAARRLRANA
ncbi:MaoC family dehydratase N-terminal domain-containing protein [Phenylobacterium sp.]|uniref:MaoC family dehydratase n=1 Tax=Phenylobacterium sp. TaxID=1871053 RepID=UPI0028985BA3|nr:MaoC family dehydratase N-terminal domain-containing protein [Phenylobacterium sp.]